MIAPTSTPASPPPPAGDGQDLPSLAARIRERLGARSIVLVGLMGAGKTTIGRRLGQRLGLTFLDADAEIEKAAAQTIPEIFAEHGEPYFRDGERRVIARILSEGPVVLATGGGAYMNEETRGNIARAGLSVWLKADLATLMTRVRRKSNRPLLNTPDPEGTMQRLMDDRYPVYAEADITIHSRDTTAETMTDEVVRALDKHLSEARPR